MVPAFFHKLTIFVKKSGTKGTVPFVPLLICEFLADTHEADDHAGQEHRQDSVDDGNSDDQRVMFGISAGSDDAADEVADQRTHGNSCREENGCLDGIDRAIGV